MNSQQVVADAWRYFIQSGEVLPVISPTIRDSWLYCRSLGLDPVQPAPGHLNKRDLASLYQESRFLQTVAHPTIKLLKEVITGTDFLVTLTNPYGDILEIVGDAEVVEMAARNNYVPGASRNTKAVGTNGIGLACDLGIPVKVSGYEHYHSDHHKWSCAAAPIMDNNAGLLGVVCFSGIADRIHQHTLGMAVAAARAIEREILITTANRSLDKNARLIEAVLKSMERGLIVVDCAGKILKANPAACQLAGLPESSIIGRLVQELIEVPHHDITGNEGVINLKSYHEGLLVSGFPLNRSLPIFVQGSLLFDEEERPFARVFVFEERRAVHRMAQKIVGHSAHFTFDDIIAQDPAMVEAINAAKSYSNYNSRVLIQGESGVGKEMFAQAIHNTSPRSLEPFVAINCGAIPRDLIESEFFGYADGAFTGARRGGKLGKVELAHRGTLFLDEVNSMPLDMQVKLLRFLQEGTFVRLGGNEEIKVDVRIISAGNVNLEQEVKSGNFRSDLYYRLSTAVVMIPPLRERPRDAMVLIEAFLMRKSHELGKQIFGLSAEAWNVVKSYNWPGNVRELENIVERAIILAEGPYITPKELPGHIQRRNGQDARIQEFRINSSGVLSRTENELICQALARTGYNVSRAAQILGISRKTLYNKMKVYQIDRGVD